MAQSLSSERAGNGITSAEFLAYVDRHDVLEERQTAAETVLKDAQAGVRAVKREKKDLRKIMAGDGINLAAFDRAMVDEKRSGEEREVEDRRYREFMAWLKKPVGFQQAMEFAPAEPTTHELHKAESGGLEAGKRGDRADSNPWTPGTEAFVRFHAGWLRGQALKVTADIKPAESLVQPAELRRRGRPAGSKNRPKDDAGENGETKPPASDSDIDDRLIAYAVMCENQVPASAVSISGASRGMEEPEDVIEAAIERLTAAGRLKQFAPGVWIMPQTGMPGQSGGGAEPPPPMAA